MKNIMVTVLIGCIAGFIDILPMLKMKLDKYAILSAFTFYFIMPFIIFNIKLLENIWWLKCGLITLVLSIPTIIIIAKMDKKSILPIASMALILGSLIGLAGHYLNIM
jgi:predicted permease